jgi:GNAT superfamily N-acetyltransferase
VGAISCSSSPQRRSARAWMRIASRLAWDTFSRFYYLTAALQTNARCFVLFVDDNPAAFAALLHRPHPIAHDIWGISRGVTLPDFQGMGLIFALMDRLAAALKALGKRCHGYPAHPAFIRSWNRSPMWQMIKKPGFRALDINKFRRSTLRQKTPIGSRPCAVMNYIGPRCSIAGWLNNCSVCDGRLRGVRSRRFRRRR